MAKPDDTRIAPASGNTPASSTVNRGIAHTATPTNASLIHLLESLLDRLKASQVAATPPKSARPPRIKPRRHVTVSGKASPATDSAIPGIRLCGNWLVPAGFGLHTRVRVHVAKGCLILIPKDGA